MMGFRFAAMSAGTRTDLRKRPDPMHMESICVCDPTGGKRDVMVIVFNVIYI
jgi:hypothetical protein